MLQPLRYIQYTAIMNITVIKTIMAIIIFISILSILYHKAIHADIKIAGSTTVITVNTEIPDHFRNL